MATKYNSHHVPAAKLAFAWRDNTIHIRRSWLFLRRGSRTIQEILTLNYVSVDFRQHVTCSRNFRVSHITAHMIGYRVSSLELRLPRFLCLYPRDSMYMYLNSNYSPMRSLSCAFRETKDVVFIPRRMLSRKCINQNPFRILSRKLQNGRHLFLINLTKHITTTWNIYLLLRISYIF